MNMTLYACLRSIILSVSGVPEVILANQNEVSPAGEYASILIAEASQARSSGIVSKTTLEDGRIRFRTKYPVTWEATINFWRGDAFERATRLLRIQYLPSVMDTLLANGIGFVGASPVTNLTALQSSSQEQRAVVTITLTTYEFVEEVVNPIERVKVLVEDEDGRTLVDSAEISKEL